jgi:hypothetical protein
VRFVKQIPHPRLSIQILSFNEKYILKFEIDGYEQLFKIPMQEIQNIELLEKIVDDDFIQNCMHRFLSMRKDFTDKLKQ